MDPREITLDIKGTVIQKTEESPMTPLKVVYQGCAPQFANYRTSTGQPRMRRAYVEVENPKTPAQLAQQQKMRSAVAAWHEATDEEKEFCRALAEKKQITVYMAFISSFIAAYIPVVGTVWDAGATSWDAGTTVWDI